MKKDEYFNKVYDETYEECLKYATSKVKDIKDLKTIVKNVFVEVHNTIKEKGIGYIQFPKAFVNQITREQIEKFYKDEETFRNNINENVKFDKGSNYEPTLEDELAIDKVSPEVMYKKIDKESLVTKKILVLYYLADLKITDISKELKISESSTKGQMFSVLNKIKKAV